jgi:hypothetical protein
MQIKNFLLLLCFLFVGSTTSCNRQITFFESWREKTVKPSGVVLPPATVQGGALGANDEPPVGFSTDTQEFVISSAQKSVAPKDEAKLKRAQKKGRHK